MNDLQEKTKRRGVLTGAATVGALAAAAAVVPLARKDNAPAPAQALRDEPASKAGYQLTAHVQLYYKTARI